MFPVLVCTSKLFGDAIVFSFSLVCYWARAASKTYQTQLQSPACEFLCSKRGSFLAGPNHDLWHLQSEDLNWTFFFSSPCLTFAEFRLRLLLLQCDKNASQNKSFPKRPQVVVSTHLENISQNGNLPLHRRENKKYLKPPPTTYGRSNVGRTHELIGSYCKSGPSTFMLTSSARYPTVHNPGRWVFVENASQTSNYEYREN